MSILGSVLAVKKLKTKYEQMYSVLQKRYPGDNFVITNNFGKYTPSLAIFVDSACERLPAVCMCPWWIKIIWVGNLGN